MLLEPVSELVGIVGTVADQAFEAQALQQGLSLPTVGRLPGREQKAQGSPKGVDQGMDLGGQPAPAAAQVLRTTTARTTGKALRLAGRGIDHHRLQGVSRDALDEQLVPKALARPAPEAAVDRADLAEGGGQILPCHPGAQHVSHRLDEPTQRLGILLPDAGNGSEPGMERRPGGVTQTMTEHEGQVSGWGCYPTWFVPAALPPSNFVRRSRAVCT